MELASALILFLAGLIASSISSMVGGLSLITIPVLLFLGLPPLETIATNLAAQLLPALIEIANYRRHGKLRFRRLIPMLLLFVLGASLGSLLVLSINTDALNALVAFLLIGGVALVAFEEKLDLEFMKRSPFLQKLFLFLIGAYKAVFGAAAKTLAIMVLRVTHGMSCVEASAASSFLLFFAVAVGSASYVLAGVVNLDYLVPLTLGCAIGSVIGTELAVKKGDSLLKPALLLIALAAAAKILFF